MCVGIIALAAGANAVVGQSHGPKEHGVFTPSDVTWGPAPASLPAGAQAAILEGDPTKDGPFTLRLRLPDGYRLPPHYHPVVEHVTVVQGHSCSASERK